VRQISARNQFDGEVINLVVDGVNAEVTLRIADGVEVTSVITRSSAERLGLALGSQATALIKASDVLVAADVEGDA
jgi:molybdopterin-binding protein